MKRLFDHIYRRLHPRYEKIEFDVDPLQLEELKKAAKEERVSLDEFIENILRKHLLKDV